MFESPRAESIASELGLEDKSLRSKVSTYSLGQTKKLSTAVALGSDANYVILDEPSNGMDRPTLLAFERILRSVSATRAILIASHDLHTFADIAGRVLLVKEQTIRDISTSVAAKIDLAQGKNVNDESTESVIEALIDDTI